jgi:hypothetical protein
LAKKLHPLVQATKIELQRLDKSTEKRSWEQIKAYNGTFLPISVEPELRPRALRFMSDLIHLLEQYGHRITFKYNRCYIEMYGQLTEINLRQKYYRRRIKDSTGYGTDTYEKSNRLEFQIVSHARKGWIDRKTKCLEDYLETIYDYVEHDSRQWAELRERQRIQEERDRVHQEKEAEKARKLAEEAERLSQLMQESDNHQKAMRIRSYLEALKKKAIRNNAFDTELQEYIDWGHKKADQIDPLTKKWKLP